MSNYDSFEAGILTEGMTSEQKLQFHREMSDAWRDPKKAARLKIWLGGIGAHHFYLGDQSRGWKSRLFFWTGIPVIMTLFEGDIKKRTQRVNSDLAMRIAARIKGGESSQASGALPPNQTQTFAAVAPTGERSYPKRWVFSAVGLVVLMLLSAVLFVNIRSTKEETTVASAPQSSISQPEAEAAKTSVASANVNLPAETEEQITGSYTYKNDGGFGEITVRTDADGVYLKIGSMNTARQVPSECEFVTEDDNGKAQRTGNLVTWSGDVMGQCKLKMKFSGDEAEVDQDGECGCGMGVTMDGKYRKATP